MANRSILVEVQTELLRKPATSDTIIKCGTREWKCQSAILAQRCDFFRVALQGPFQEAKAKLVQLKDDKPEGVDMLLLYLYTMQIPSFTEAKSAEDAFLIGDKYNVPALRAGGRKQLEELLTTESLEFASVSKPRHLSCIAWIEKVYTWEVEGAKEIKEAILVAVVKVSESIIEQEKLQDLIERNGEFRLTFLRALSKKAAAQSAARMRCPICDSEEGSD